MGGPWWFWWLELSACTTAARVQSLAWEPRSHIKPLEAVAKKKKKKEGVVEGLGNICKWFIHIPPATKPVAAWDSLKNLGRRWVKGPLYR